MFAYLDHNSTSEPSILVKEKLISLLSQGALNSSSIHSKGRLAKKIIEESRMNILHSVQANNDYELVFTSCATESNNTIISNFKEGAVLCSAAEHLSVLGPVSKLANHYVIKVNDNGHINLDDLSANLKKFDKKQKLVSVIFANNETGAIQDLKQISSMCKAHGALLHTDAVQAWGRIDFSLNDLSSPDYITISCHKSGGLIGAAAIIKKKKAPLLPLIIGGGQESGFRAATSNLLAIASFGEVAKNIKSIIAEFQKTQALRDFLEEKIKKLRQDVVIFAKTSPRLPNTSCFAAKGLSQELQLVKLDLAGICVSSGAACSSGRIEPSHAIKAMGYSNEIASCAIRLSLGPQNTQAEIEYFIKHWEEIACQ